MNRSFKRILKITGILLLVIVGAAIALAEIFESKIGQRVVSEINKQITTELRVGDFDLSLLTAFPNVAANLKDVVLEGATDGRLLEAKELSVRLGLLSLLSSNVKVKKIVISEGALNVMIDKQGKPNYDIAVASEEDPGADTDEVGTGVNVKRAEFRDIELLYQDEQNDYYVNTWLHKASLSGQFGTAQFDLESEADLDMGFIEIDGDRFLEGRRLLYDAKVAVDNASKNYDLERFILTLDKLKIAVDGKVVTEEEETDFDLQFASEEGSLKEVLALLPVRYQNNMKGLETKGDFSLTGFVRGRTRGKEQPEIGAELRFANGRVSGDMMDGKIKDLSFLARFSNGKERNSKSSVFEIKDLRGYFAQELFEMNLRVANLDDPRIGFGADGALPVGVIYGLLGHERITDGGGEIEINGLKLEGRLNDMMRSSRMGRVKALGSLQFDDAYLVVNDEKVILDRGILELRDNELAINELKFEGPGTEIILNGQAQNFIPVIFADSINSQGAELRFNANLLAEEIDIDQLMALAGPTEEVKEEAVKKGVIDSLKTAQIQENEFFTKFLNGTFRAQVKSFNYEKIEGEDFEGSISFANNEMDIEGRTNAMGGELVLDGEMYFQDQPKLVARVTCNKVNITDFFEQSENFGQEVLQSQHISGDLDARIAIYAFWDRSGNFQTDKLRVLAGIGLQNGELKDFAMLDNFSAFVKVKDLKKIRFSNLSNFLEVRNRRLFIPAMFVQSNALNLTVSGEHTFDQEIEYYLKVNAGQVLMNKIKKHDGSLSPKPARRKGFFNLHYAILGTIDQYNYKADKKRVKNDFRISESRKRDIQMALEREFQTIIELVEEPLDWRDIPEYGDPSADAEEEEMLDFDVEGGSSNGGGGK